MIDLLSKTAICLAKQLFLLVCWVSRQAETIQSGHSTLDITGMHYM